MSNRLHEGAGLAVEAATRSAGSGVALLARQAASALKASPGWKTTSATVRAEDAEPGRLSMSVHGPGGTAIHPGFVPGVTRAAAARAKSVPLRGPVSPATRCGSR